MRSTVSINDTLLKQAKEASLKRGCTLGQVIEDALRASLATRNKPSDSSDVRPFKTHGRGGVQPGVDLNSSAALVETMGDR